MERTSEQRRILESVAYHWSEADRAVIYFPECSVIEHSRAFTNYGTASMGLLDRLPRELLYCILSNLDFESLGAMRCLNIRSNNAVEALPAYRDIRFFAQDSLRALSATNLLSYYRAKYLHSVLCQGRCTCCAAFGSFLFLPTGRRYCFSCIEENPELAVVSVSKAAALYGLADKALKQIAIMTTVSGDYGISQKTQRRRIRIVSQQEARTLGIVMHGGEKAMERAVSLGIRCSNGLQSHSRSRKAVIRQTTRSPGADGTLRFMACTPFPYLDKERRRIDRGVCCRGCEYSWYRRDEDFPVGYDVDKHLYAKMNRAFSENEFLIHFDGCHAVEILWEEYVLKGKGVWESDRSTLFRA